MILPQKLCSADRKSVVWGKRGDLGGWSSGVCSSDLTGNGINLQALRAPTKNPVWRRVAASDDIDPKTLFCRSEERRVGKEGRSRWLEFRRVLFRSNG